MKTIENILDSVNKFGDTETVFRLMLKDGDDYVSLDNKHVVLNIANSYGLVSSVPLTNQVGHTIELDFKSEELSKLTPDAYKLEFEVTTIDGDIAKFPTKDGLPFHITNNLKQTQGTLIPTITFDEVLSAVDDKVNEYVHTIQKGDTGETGATGVVDTAKDYTWTGTNTFNKKIIAPAGVQGNSDTTTKLQTARLVGGVSFDGTSDITLPGVNAKGNQDTSGRASNATHADNANRAASSDIAAKAIALQTPRKINGTPFDGTSDITIADGSISISKFDDSIKQKLSDYDTLDTAVINLNTDLKDYQTKINYVEFKNHVGEEAFEESKYWTTSANKIVKATGTNVASVPKIRIKANTRYSIRRVTNSFCYLGTDDDVLISKLSDYAGFTSFAYGDETCYSLITDTDCWLYMSYQTNRDYKTITVVEGKLPAKYYKYGFVYRKEINGVPIGGAWHEKIVVDKGGSGDYKDLNTAMNYVTDGDTLHWTDIILKDDEHLITKEITIPDYCRIIGESGNRDKCIVNFVPTDNSDYAVSTYSAFRMNKNSVLKDFTLKAINCRYCVHSDSSNTIKDWVQTLENMKIEHLTNTSGSWESQNPWGGGASSGCLLTATDCVFIAHSAKAYAFSVHNNSNFETPFRHVFSKCEFYSENYGSFKCEGLPSNTDDIVYCENCYFSSPIYLTNSLSIRMICSGCNIQQCNSTNYFAPNSVAEFREVTEKLKNASGSKIEKGTLVAYSGVRLQVRPMTENDDANIFAGFTIGDTEPNEECTVITDGFYRYTDDLTFGTKYGVSNGKPSKTADNKIGICVGGGFIHLTARY